MSLTLPVDIYSPDQLNELILELQDVAGEVRDSGVRQENARTDLREISSDLQLLIEQNHIEAINAGTLENLAKDLQNTLDSAPSVHMLLAAMPGRAMKRQFTTWFRTEIHPLSLLTFAARSDLGGGAIVQVGSHLYDLSFRRSIIDHKARLTEIAGV